MRIFYTLFGLLVIVGYGWTTFNGYELRPTKRQFAPKSVRGQSGGASSVYYRGYRGGK